MLLGGGGVRESIIIYSTLPKHINQFVNFGRCELNPTRIVFSQKGYMPNPDLSK